MLHEVIPNMPEHRLLPLVEAFVRALSTASEFSGLYLQAEWGDGLGRDRAASD